MNETKIWQITHTHPFRTYGSTVFYVRAKEQPEIHQIIAYIEKYLSEEYDDMFEDIYINEFYFNPDSLVNLDEME